MLKVQNVIEGGSMSSPSQLSHIQPVGQRIENTEPGPQRPRKDMKERETPFKHRLNRNQQRQQTAECTSPTLPLGENKRHPSAYPVQDYTSIRLPDFHLPNQNSHQKFALLSDPLARLGLQAKPQSLKKGLLSPQVTRKDLMYPIPSPRLNVL